MASVGVGQQHGVWEMLAQHVGIADWNHIIEDAVDYQARLGDLASLAKRSPLYCSQARKAMI